MRRLFTLSTAGSVDDGKSTLLGRLVHDAQGLFADTEESLQVGAAIDFSRLTDGLVAEREQGITIDVAWRHLKVGPLRFLLADSPGHEQYTRNLVTAASHADALLVLVDPLRLELADETPRLLTQTVRHAAIAALLRVPHVAFVVNKLDAFDAPEPVFAKLRAALLGLARELRLDERAATLDVLPASALTGDNIVRRGAHLAWFDGPTVMEWLEQVSATPDPAAEPGVGACLPIQISLRTAGASAQPFRAVAGRLEQGRLSVGDRVRVLPSDVQTTIAALFHLGRAVKSADAGQSISATLADERDAARGDWLVSDTAPRGLHRRFRARVAWLAPQAGRPGARLTLKMGSTQTAARIVGLVGKLESATTHDAIELNELVEVDIETAVALPVEPAGARLSVRSRFVLLDPASWATLAAGIVDAVPQEAAA